MSRIGKMPIAIPSGVKVNIEGNTVTVSGPKGELSRSLPGDMLLNLDVNVLTVSRPSNSNQHRSYHGLTRSLLANMVEGVSKGYEKLLEVVGVGYRAQKAGDKLVLQVGFTHPVEVLPAPGISLSVEGTNRIKVAGIDKESVGEAAAKIRAIRPCDSYKGKGVRYLGESLRLKPGKAGRAAAKKK